MRNSTQDPRHAQANREALISLAVYALYFIWWYACAYMLGQGDPDSYDYVLGLPAWFFYSCIAGYPLITVLLWLALRLGFRNMPLDARPEDAAGNGPHPEEERRG
ncbi:MAG: YhdT family protein [Desulfovibrionaceae bacterium]|nr:YhdT family protein [Desulfovibrionaceae bacterium]